MHAGAEKVFQRFFRTGKTSIFLSYRPLLIFGRFTQPFFALTQDTRFINSISIVPFSSIPYREGSVIQDNYYETDDQIAVYSEFHYGTEYFDVAIYPKRCAELCLSFMDGRRKERSLDLGCAVGRSTFELARGFDSVTGLDFSRGFIRVAVEMKEKGLIQYALPEEGELVSHHEKRLADFGLADTQNKVTFRQGDAQDLDPSLTDYNLIFAGNLIDRLPNPARFLTHIHERLRIGGLLIITSPYTWLPDFTPREKWIGGFIKDGQPFTTQDGMTGLLSPCFELIDDTHQVPFVIRETRRKFQHTIAAVTVWERVN